MLSSYTKLNIFDKIINKTHKSKIKSNTVDPVYSERVGAAKSVHLHWVFTINVFNLTIN